LQKDGFSSANILVVAPPNLIDTWVNEITRLKSNIVTLNILSNTIQVTKSNKKFNIDIIRNETFSSDQYESIGDYDAIIVDEGQKFKQRDGIEESIRSNNLIKFVNDRKTIYRVMLTGTPVVNDPSEYVNLVNGFSGEELIPSGGIKAIPRLIDRACAIHLYSSCVVIRRTKDYIMNLPPLKVIEVPVVLGEKELIEAREFNNYVRVAIFESKHKVKAIRNIILSHKNAKGLVFSYFIYGGDKTEEGILMEHYLNCPESHKSIYIAGDQVIDINGNKLPYSFENALVARSQFENSNSPVIAYVSTGTCREGINEFSCSDFVIHGILPYEAASFGQANSRAYRDGRSDKE
jgi:SNF2 family DNA or RNA helicase